jgi:hypothetical protein
VAVGRDRVRQKVVREGFLHFDASVRIGHAAGDA